MIDFLFALGQVVCIVGLLYGAYLAITFVDDEWRFSATSVRFDPKTTHAWESPRRSPGERLTAL
jgi:hypothetical protein